jgi:hypothetical protein
MFAQDLVSTIKFKMKAQVTTIWVTKADHVFPAINRTCYYFLLHFNDNCRPPYNTAIDHYLYNKIFAHLEDQQHLNESQKPPITPF